MNILADYEISLLRLLEKVTNGTIIEISLTGKFPCHSQSRFDLDNIMCAGTAILLKPGIISGGSLTHECPLSRSIGYFLEPLVMLAPFAKKAFQVTLRGITTDDNDLSVGDLASPENPD
jgi:RNA 3'-terminal phosphate cyclase-like protein